MQNFFSRYWHARSIAVLAVVFFSSAHPIRSAEPLAKAGAKSAKAPEVASADTGVFAASALPVKLFSARALCVADTAPAKAPLARKSPAPIIVTVGPNGLTINSEDLDALDEFEHLLTEAADGSGNEPMAVFYLKYANAQTVKEELDKILSGGVPDSNGSPGNGADLSRLSTTRRLVTGPVKITPEVRLNALIVLASRADQDEIERLLKILDRKESPEDVATPTKTRLIPVYYARAKELESILRQVYADRVVLTPFLEQQGGRGGGVLPFLMGAMGGGRGGRGGGGGGGAGRGGGGGNTNGGGGNGGGGRGAQNRVDPATRISITADTRTNILVVVAADTLFKDVEQTVRDLDAAAFAQHETVRVVTVNRTSATAVENALAAFGGDAVQANDSGTNFPATNGRGNTNSALSPSASRGSSGMSGGQRSMGNSRLPGGSPSPYQGFGGQRGSRYSQSGRPGQ